VKGRENVAERSEDMGAIQSTEVPPMTDPPIADLLRQLSEQTTALVRQEVQLAKAELAVKGKRAGLGAGMFGGAGIFGLYAIGALTACAVLALSKAVDGWLASLIVAAVYGAIAGVLAMTGKSKVQQATPPVPEQAVESVKEDVEWTKQRASEGRR
jgi:Putative Actinobacterial Holin-X, holin superfamily III